MPYNDNDTTTDRTSQFNTPTAAQRDEGRQELQQQVQASLDAIKAWEESEPSEPKPRIRVGN